MEPLFNNITGLGRQLYEKETPGQVCSCEYCETFKNTYFVEHLQTVASDTLSHLLKKISKH